MAQVLIRGLSDETVANWKARAKRHNRSLEAELRELIERNQQPELEMSWEEAVRFGDEMRRRLAGRVTGTAAESIREDRDSR